MHTALGAAYEKALGWEETQHIQGKCKGPCGCRGESKGERDVSRGRKAGQVRQRQSLEPHHPRGGLFLSFPVILPLELTRSLVSLEA